MRAGALFFMLTTRFPVFNPRSVGYVLKQSHWVSPVNHSFNSLRTGPNESKCGGCKAGTKTEILASQEWVVPRLSPALRWHQTFPKAHCPAQASCTADRKGRSAGPVVSKHHSHRMTRRWKIASLFSMAIDSQPACLILKTWVSHPYCST